MEDTNLELSRRKVLGSIGAVGAVGATAGLGTNAYFSDEESFTDNQLVAGELDMKVGWDEHYYDGGARDGLQYPVITDLQEASPNEEPRRDEYVGLPTLQDSVLYVHQNDVERFLDNTRHERFPEGGLGDDADPCEALGDVPGDLDAPLIELDDVKPGDFGEVTFSFALCDNPGFVYLTGGLQDAAENGVTEPEAEADAEQSDTIELLDAVQVGFWYDEDCDNSPGRNIDAEPPVETFTLREMLSTFENGNGLFVDADPRSGDDECFAASERHCIGFGWWVPRSVGNEIQSDSVTFDLGFYTEQCRHNEPATTTQDGGDT